MALPRAESSAATRDTATARERAFGAGQDRDCVWYAFGLLLSGGAKTLASFKVPEFESMVSVERENALALWRDHDGLHTPFVAFECAKALSCIDVPKPQSLVIAFAIR
jgi:hypothetical protein